MQPATLQRIVRTASHDLCERRLEGYDWACKVADVNTVDRAAMLLAMVCEESASLNASEEYASGAEYEGRADLGNTQPGDGERFKGRSGIQITGRNNYGRISRWAHKRGIVPTSTYFLDHPATLAHDRFFWVGPAQYWLGDHNHGYSSINAAADHRDIYSATLMVNGGLNGYDTRKLYYSRALALGDAILPNKITTGEPNMMAYKSGDHYYVLQDGAKVRRVYHDYAKNIAAMSGRPIATVTPAMHDRIQHNQALAARGK